MTRTIVHLVRHGEVYNPMKLLYGRMPGFHLSARGRSMAAVTAQFFADRDVTYLASSPLQRAQETAAPIAEVTGCEVDTLDDVIESLNTFEGLRTKGWRSQLWYPPRWRHMVNPLEPSWGSPTRRSWSACCAVLSTRALKQKATRPLWSATSCPSSRCSATCRANDCRT